MVAPLCRARGAGPREYGTVLRPSGRGRKAVRWLVVAIPSFQIEQRHPMSDLVPETAIDYDEVFRRGGRNHGDEDFALFKCPLCGRVFLIDYEVETVYLDGTDLSHRTLVAGKSFTCLGCGQLVPDDEPWIGPKASLRFGVTWKDLAASDWAWAARPE